MPWPVTLVMLGVSQGRHWQVRRTKAHMGCIEDEDVTRGVTGRPQRGKRCRSGHQDPLQPNMIDVMAENRSWSAAGHRSTAAADSR